MYLLSAPGGLLLHVDQVHYELCPRPRTQPHLPKRILRCRFRRCALDKNSTLDTKGKEEDETLLKQARWHANSEKLLKYRFGGSNRAIIFTLPKTTNQSSGRKPKFTTLQPQTVNRRKFNDDLSTAQRHTLYAPLHWKQWCESGSEKTSFRIRIRAAPDPKWILSKITLKNKCSNKKFKFIFVKKCP
jgi:hypothetical protein